MKEIVLASQSARRKELLKKCIPSFIIDPADIDETLKEGISISEAIEELSYRKAKEVLNRHPDSIVIGSDTAVTLNNVIFGKPKDEEDAFRMLKQLQGNTHEVITGLAIISLDHVYTDVTISKVTFSSMSDEEILSYIHTGECSDKAGAYAIQGYGGRYIEKIEGDYYSIMGLPLHLVYEELKKENN